MMKINNDKVWRAYVSANSCHVIVTSARRGDPGRAADDIYCQPNTPANVATAQAMVRTHNAELLAELMKHAGTSQMADDAIAVVKLLISEVQ